MKLTDQIADIANSVRRMGGNPRDCVVRSPLETHLNIAHRIMREWGSAHFMYTEEDYMTEFRVHSVKFVPIRKTI